MAIVADLASCLDVDPGDIVGLVGLLEAFALTIPDLVSLDFVTKIPDLPGSVIELFIGNLGADVPSFSANIPGLGTVSFAGADIPSPPGVPAFDIGTLDAGMLSLIVGLGGILISLPELFIDIGPPPILKVPVLPDAVIELVSIQLALPNEPILTVDFKSKVVECVVQIVLGVLP